MWQRTVSPTRTDAMYETDFWCTSGYVDDVIFANSRPVEAIMADTQSDSRGAAPGGAKCAVYECRVFQSAVSSSHLAGAASRRSVVAGGSTTSPWWSTVDTRTAGALTRHDDNVSRGMNSIVSHFGTVASILAPLLVRIIVEIWINIIRTAFK